MNEIVKDIKTERVRQDSKWGGATHDDAHNSHDWITFITKQLGKGVIHPFDAPTYRRQMVKVAALAVAAIEWIDRVSVRKVDRLEQPITASFRAAVNEEYSYLTDCGEMFTTFERNTDSDAYRHSTGNYAPPTKEGRAWLKKRKARELAIGRVTRALRQAERELGAEPVEWRDCIQRKFYPELRHFSGDDMRGEITVQSVVVVQNPLSVPYSTSKEAWKHVIKSHEDDLRIIMEG